MPPRMMKRGRTNMRIEKILIALVLTAASGLAVSTELPGRNDYAYRFPLQTGAGSEFFAVDLSFEVYQSVSDPALRDAGVYNAGGQDLLEEVCGFCHSLNLYVNP